MNSLENSTINSSNHQSIKPVKSLLEVSSQYINGVKDLEKEETSKEALLFLSVNALIDAKQAIKNDPYLSKAWSKYLKNKKNNQNNNQSNEQSLKESEKNNNLKLNNNRVIEQNFLERIEGLNKLSPQSKITSSTSSLEDLLHLEQQLNSLGLFKETSNNFLSLNFLNKKNEKSHEKIEKNVHFTPFSPQSHSYSNQINTIKNLNNINEDLTYSLLSYETLPPSTYTNPSPLTNINTNITSAHDYNNPFSYLSSPLSLPLRLTSFLPSPITSLASFKQPSTLTNKENIKTPSSNLKLDENTLWNQESVFLDSHSNLKKNTHPPFNLSPPSLSIDPVNSPILQYDTMCGLSNEEINAIVESIHSHLQSSSSSSIQANGKDSENVLIPIQYINKLLQVIQHLQSQSPYLYNIHQQYLKDFQMKYDKLREELWLFARQYPSYNNPANKIVNENGEWPLLKSHIDQNNKENNIIKQERIDEKEKKDMENTNSLNNDKNKKFTFPSFPSSSTTSSLNNIPSTPNKTQSLENTIESLKAIIHELKEKEKKEELISRKVRYKLNLVYEELKKRDALMREYHQIIVDNNIPISHLPLPNKVSSNDFSSSSLPIPPTPPSSSGPLGSPSPIYQSGLPPTLKNRNPLAIITNSSQPTTKFNQLTSPSARANTSSASTLESLNKTRNI